MMLLALLFAHSLATDVMLDENPEDPLYGTKFDKSGQSKKWCFAPGTVFHPDICQDYPQNVDSLFHASLKLGHRSRAPRVQFTGENWMSQMSLATNWANLPLNQIFMIGAHDAQSYPTGYDFEAIGGKVMKSINVDYFQGTFTKLKVKMGALQKISTYLWGVAHSVDIFRQLMQGIRFFDLRIFYDDANNIFGTHHGLRNQNLDVIVQQARDFAVTHPDEVVFLRFKFEGVPSVLSEATDPVMVDIIEIIKDRVFRPDQLETGELGRETIQKIRSANKNIVIVQSSFSALSSMTEWAFPEEDIKEGKATQKCCQAGIQLTAQDKTLLLVQSKYQDREDDLLGKLIFVYMTMTGSPEAIKDMQAFHSLRHVTDAMWKDALPAVAERLLQGQTGYERANVLMLDWFRPKLFELAMRVNIRRATKPKQSTITELDDSTSFEAEDREVDFPELPVNSTPSDFDKEPVPIIKTKKGKVKPEKKPKAIGKEKTGKKEKKGQVGLDVKLQKVDKPTNGERTDKLKAPKPPTRKTKKSSKFDFDDTVPPMPVMTKTVGGQVDLDDEVPFEDEDIRLVQKKQKKPGLFSKRKKYEKS